MNRTAPTLLHCERNHVADDYSPFSSGFIISGEQTLGEACDIRLSTRAAVQIRLLVGFIPAPFQNTSPPPSISQAQRERKLCHDHVADVRLSQRAGRRNRCEMTSAAETRLHILCHSEWFMKAFSVASPICSCQVLVCLCVNSQTKKKHSSVSFLQLCS